MIIGACGFGSTGSSVVTDYLSEYDQITVKDSFEFTWVSGVDGLIDLERAVMNPHNRTSDSITAIRRFEALAKRMEHRYELHGLPASEFERLIKQFVESITTVKWDWYDHSIKRGYNLKFLAYYLMKSKIIPKMERKKNHTVNCWPLKKVRLSVLPDNFYEEAKKLVDGMLQGMGFDTNGIIALDQPFAGNNPQACFPFYHDPYAVVVDRDPRDLYVFAKTRLLGRNHFMAVEPVEDFIKYYRAIRKNQPYLQVNPRILRIRFEDMVYEYDRTSKLLRDFLHLPENPRPKSVFDPNLSIANTQVFKRYSQFSEDIRKIENELSEYLFDYSPYPEPDLSKKMFYGKSPKNKLFKKRFIEQ